MSFLQENRGRDERESKLEDSLRYVLFFKGENISLFSGVVKALITNGEHEQIVAIFRVLEERIKEINEKNPESLILLTLQKLHNELSSAINKGKNIGKTTVVA